MEKKCEKERGLRSKKILCDSLAFVKALGSKKILQKMITMNDLMQIPGIGVALSRDLNSIGIKSVGDLKGRSAEILYKKLCTKQGKRLDPCVLYAFRCAVYYASGGRHKERLKWWNWKN